MEYFNKKQFSLKYKVVSVYIRFSKFHVYIGYMMTNKSGSKYDHIKM